MKIEGIEKIKMYFMELFRCITFKKK